MMDVLEIDGVTLKKGENAHKTAGLELAPGQRVSVAVEFQASWTTKRIMVRSEPPRDY